jgi:branched-chain amino acid transport system permease protein
MGSIAGSILTGLGLGLIEGLTKFLYAPASDVVVFVVMALVLLLRPRGLLGEEGMLT